MATVTAFIRSIKTDKNKPVHVRFRLRDGRTGIDKETGKAYDGIQLFHKSELTVLPDRWDERQQKIKTRAVIDEREKKNFDKAINDRKDIIRDIYLVKGKTLTPDNLEIEIGKRLHPDNHPVNKFSFLDLYNKFLSDNSVSANTLKKRHTVRNALLRFENHSGSALDIHSMNADSLKLIESFFRNEDGLTVRSNNTVSIMIQILRTFFIWCEKNEYIKNKPFAKYKAPSEKYGTPFFISVEERNNLFRFDLSKRPALERQRDIFVFQCVIGCRVGDLYKLTKNSVIGGAILYVAEKTKGNEPRTVKVPLNAVAIEILSKYAALDGDKLLPFISEQQYNNAIKEVFTLAGLNRNVIARNPLTGEDEARPLNEIASSHLARRTFCGNLYKRVKDPSLVGALSGHVEGSKAFARYRDIDDEMKSELVKMLE